MVATLYKTKLPKHKNINQYEGIEKIIIEKKKPFRRIGLGKINNVHTYTRAIILKKKHKATSFYLLVCGGDGARLFLCKYIILKNRLTHTQQAHIKTKKNKLKKEKFK